VSSKEPQSQDHKNHDETKGSETSTNTSVSDELKLIIQEIINNVEIEINKKTQVEKNDLASDLSKSDQK